MSDVYMGVSCPDSKYKLATIEWFSIKADSFIGRMGEVTMKRICYCRADVISTLMNPVIANTLDYLQ